MNTIPIGVGNIVASVFGDNMNKISYLKTIDLKKDKVVIASEAYDRALEEFKGTVEQVLKSYVSGDSILHHLMEVLEKEKIYGQD